MKTLHFDNSDKLYFTSDLHLGHAKIIDYCSRPFKDVDEMDKALIKNWNDIIREDDIVFILGDFCWRMGNSSIKRYLDHLFGRKIIILGNHDKNEKIFKGLTEAVYDGFVNIRIKDEDVKEGYQRITLCHYPMLSWYQSHRGAWQFFGHWHNNTLASFKGKMRTDDDEVMDFIKAEHKSAEYLKNVQYDVGVDGNDFTPVSYNSIKNFITKLSYKK